MPTNRHAARLPVALPELSDNMRNTLTLFFESRLCPLNIELVGPEHATVGIFDYDHPLSRKEADHWIANRPDAHIVLISLQPLDRPGVTSLGKPVKPKELLAALEAILGQNGVPARPAPRMDDIPSPASSGSNDSPRAPASLETPETIPPATQTQQVDDLPQERKGTAKTMETDTLNNPPIPATPEEKPAAEPSRPADGPSDSALVAEAYGLDWENSEVIAFETPWDGSPTDPALSKDGQEEIHDEPAPMTQASETPTNASSQTPAPNNVVNLVTPKAASHSAPSLQAVPNDPNLETLLEEVNWQLDFGDISKAREMLESALEANPKQSILHHEILQLYGWTSDQEHFYTMYEKLDMNNVPYAEKWVKLKEFFDQTN